MNSIDRIDRSEMLRKLAEEINVMGWNDVGQMVNAKTHTESIVSMIRKLAHEYDQAEKNGFADDDED